MTRISEAEYRALSGTPSKEPKYHNKKVKYYDPDSKQSITFDSVKEYEYYLILKDREKRGEIGGLKRQFKIEIQPAFTTPDGERIQAINYIADFVYYDMRAKEGYPRHIVDTKGVRTDVYKLKKKLLAYKGIYIEEV